MVFYHYVFKFTKLFLSSMSSSVTQSCPHFATPWTAAHQASLSITNSQSLLKLMFIESVMPTNRFILYRPFLLPAIFLSISRFQWVSSLHQVAAVLELQLQHQSFRWIFRTDFLEDELLGSPCCPRDSDCLRNLGYFWGQSS